MAAVGLSIHRGRGGGPGGLRAAPLGGVVVLPALEGAGQDGVRLRHRLKPRLSLRRLADVPARRGPSRRTDPPPTAPALFSEPHEMRESPNKAGAPLPQPTIYLSGQHHHRGCAGVWHLDCTSLGSDSEKKLPCGLSAQSR